MVTKGGIKVETLWKCMGRSSLGISRQNSVATAGWLQDGNCDKTISIKIAELGKPKATFK